MNRNKNEDKKQEERLDYLVKEFKADSDQYKELQTPADTEGKRRILRSLMNVRMPKKMDQSVLSVQDDYLSERALEKGIVSLPDIPTVAEQGSNSSFADKISIWQGDITRLAADAIVNAANSQMLGCFIPMHTCIDNCIHTFAGVQLRAECDRQMRELRKKYGRDYEQPTAVPMLTLEKDLADCYRNTLDLCEQNGLRSVAFCCISTGVFRFPNKRAAEIAVQTVTDWMSVHPGAVERVIFNVFKDEDKEYYEQLLR